MSVIFKCKMCGGTLQADLQKKIAVCDSCGTEQTISSTDDEKKANMFDRANHLRMNNEYDKALAMYEKMLELDSNDAEIYWSIVLCRYGIEYVEDPATHKRIPTINRLQYDSVLLDSDYKMALQKANLYQKEIYEKEAQIIDDIQKGILAISKQEEPFDVFICYKETDNSGRRTRDSVLANDLYHQLSNEGFKVFFSRITLEDKLGEQYEPYIFAALNSAKVMVVLGTNKDYFNAVWVKNEWSRFLTLAKKDGHKTLIPAYKDMDPYDLPEEFSHLQAQDMAKLGFMTDLIRGIKKILELSKGGVFGGTANMGQPQMANNNINSLLKRAQMALEAGEFARADEFCEQVLNQDAENGVAYLGKLMVDTKTHVPKELKEVANPFDNNLNYQRCIRYADKKIVDELNGYNNYIKDRNAYNEAVISMKKAKTEKDYNNAATKFQQISNYENAKQLAEECLAKANKMIFDEAEKIFNFATTDTSFLDAVKLYEKVSGYYDVKDKIAECQQKAERIKLEKRRKAEEIEFENKKKAEERRIAEEKARKKRKRILNSLKIFIIVGTIIYAMCVIYVSFIKYTPMERAKAGDLVKFGNYQGKELEWQVLDVKDSRKLLVTKYGIEVLQFDINGNNIWCESSVRKWLNNDFYNQVFEKPQRNFIEWSSLNDDYGNKTYDKVFLLTHNEVCQYFSNIKKRKCELSTTITKNFGNKCYWWLRSFNSGGIDYILDDGNLCQQGSIGTDWHTVRPVIWVDINPITAAEQGHAPAQFNLGYMYHEGQGVEQDYGQAVKWFRKAAEQGYAPAQSNLGGMYAIGEGVEQDYGQAVKWFRKAAEQGYAEAQNNLGVMYDEGLGVEQDYVQASKWYGKAAEQGVKRDYGQEVKWYRKAAEQGDAKAQYNLGYMYAKGRGGKQDYGQAVKWYRKAAEQGHADAQCNLGYMYHEGQGVERDYGQAVKWFRKAAEQGHALAQCNLACMYHDGQGVEKDYGQAVKWLKKAAEQGYAEAQNQLKKIGEKW